MSEAKHTLTETMEQALTWAQTHGGLRRWPGGYWIGADEEFQNRGNWFGTSTVEAMVKRGVLVYDQWKQSGSRQFPIRAALTKATGSAS